jgi:hypothetical protein
VEEAGSTMPSAVFLSSGKIPCCCLIPSSISGCRAVHLSYLTPCSAVIEHRGRARRLHSAKRGRGR